MKRLEKLSCDLELKRLETDGIKSKLYQLFRDSIDETIYYRFILLKKVADKYPKISYYLLWKDEFSPILNMSLIVSYMYKKKGKTNEDYIQDLMEFRNKIHFADFN